MSGNLRGIVLMVLAMAGFAIEDLGVKLAGASLPVGQMLLILGIYGTLFFSLLLRLQRAPSLIDSRAFHPAVMWRNLGEVVGTYGFVMALTLAQLSTATAVFQAMPLAVTLGAALFLGESVGWRRWLAIAVGFIGVLLIIRPGMAGFEANALWAVLAVFALALRDLATRRAPAEIHSLQIAGWGLIAVTALGAVMVAVQGVTALPDLRAVLVLLAGSSVGFIAYWGLISATRLAEMSVTTPFRYSRLVFALILGAIFFDERPDLWTWIGSALVVGSGLYALAREHRLRRLSKPGAPR